MSEIEEEIKVLQLEYDWLLQQDVNLMFAELQKVIKKCKDLFLPDEHEPTTTKPQMFVMNSQLQGQTTNLKCVITLQGDYIIQGDLNIQIQKHHLSNYRTTITSDHPWKLQQIQDATNHLQLAISQLNCLLGQKVFHVIEDVLLPLGRIMGCLQRCYNSLMAPKRTNIEELMKNKNMKSLSPLLPADMVISFYLQGSKLNCACYQVSYHHDKITFNVTQAETVIPWIKKILSQLTTAMHLAQHFKNKIFLQFKDCQSFSRSSASCSL